MIENSEGAMIEAEKMVSMYISRIADRRYNMIYRMDKPVSWELLVMLLEAWKFTLETIKHYRFTHYCRTGRFPD